MFELKEGGRDVEDYASSGAAIELIETRNEFAKSLERVMEGLLPRGARSQGDQASSQSDRRMLRRRNRRTDRKRGRG